MPDANNVDLTETNEFGFESNLERRVRNLALASSTPSNSLVPIYEAIYNALHAVQDGFGEAWQKKARIFVTFFDLDSSQPSVQIRDNGIGLNPENFKSFRTYDSDRKANRGGKGVGRLTWLKVFEEIEVESRFLVEKELFKRSFQLRLDNKAPIQKHLLGQEGGEVGTTVTLRRMRTAYSQHMPRRMDTVLKKLVAHFLPYFLSGQKPSITIETEAESFDLAPFLETKQIGLQAADFLSAEGDPLHLEHNLLERGVVEGGPAHQLYFTANERVVTQVDIGVPLGLTTYIEREGAKYVYAGVVSGKPLDESVNSERTSFDVARDSFEGIFRSAMAKSQEVLAPQIERVVKQQTDLTISVIKKYPRYSYVVGNAREFVEKKIPRNFRTAEQIYQQLAIFDYRENRDIERKVDSVSRTADSEPDDVIRSGVEEIVGRLTNQEFSVLADYTVRRKVVLDLLDRRLGYRPDGTMKHHAEKALHDFVVPMKTTNADVHIDKHNLWIVDDKLTYYEHWASDKLMKSVVQDTESASRPDVLLFSGRTAFHRPGTDQPIVLVEFKKPARDDYSDSENPFSQIYGYIEELRSGKVLDKSGALIQEIDENTPFFCYIIADLTVKLRGWLKMAQINVPLPGGGGYYGYNDNYKAFIQALSYKYVLKDARLRNEAFFKQLKI